VRLLAVSAKKNIFPTPLTRKERIAILVKCRGEKTTHGN
jgi:hypothetical protein